MAVVNKIFFAVMLLRVWAAVFVFYVTVMCSVRFCLIGVGGDAISVVIFGVSAFRRISRCVYRVFTSFFYFSTYFVGFLSWFVEWDGNCEEGVSA